MTKSAFYEVYFTIIHTATSGKKYKGEYMDTQTAASKTDAIALTKAGAAAWKEADTDVMTNFMAQKID